MKDYEVNLLPPAPPNVTQRSHRGHAVYRITFLIVIAEQTLQDFRTSALHGFGNKFWLKE